MFVREYDSPLGEIKIISDGNFLTGLCFSDTVGEIQGEREKSLPVFDETEKWLDVYFSGKAPDFTPQIKIFGSDFQKLVYKIMLEIPFGQIKTYSEIASEIAHIRGIPKMAAQAVGGATARNVISLIIPCHRVIGVNGNLVGYGGHMERKIKLLRHEGIDTSKFFDPTTL